MWKTVTEANTWSDKLALWVQDLKERNLTFGIETDFSEYLDVETDYGECKVQVMEDNTPILNYAFGRTGKYLDIFGSEDDLLKMTSNRISYNLNIDLKNLVDYNDICVLSEKCKKLILSGNMDADKESVSIVLTGTCDLQFDRGLHFDKLLFLGDFSHKITLREFIVAQKIDVLSIMSQKYTFQHCHIKELRTTDYSLLDDVRHSVVESCKVLSIFGYDRAVRESEIFKSTLKQIEKKIKYLHAGVGGNIEWYASIRQGAELVDSAKANHTYDYKLSQDYWYVYFRVWGESYLQVAQDEVIRELAKCLKIDEKSFDTSHIEDDVLITESQSGMHIQFIFTTMENMEIYDILREAEVGKYV